MHSFFRPLCVFILFILYASFSYSDWATLIVKNETTGEKINLAPKLGFVTTEDGVKTMIATFAIPFGTDNGKAINITGNSVIFKKEWQKKDGEAVVGIGALFTQLKIESSSGKSIPFKLKLNLKTAHIVENGCKKLGVTAVDDKTINAPLFIGIKCEKKGTQELIHVSVPEEVEWQSISIFELAGKGERWKMYDLTQIGATTSGITALSFKWKDKPFIVNLKRDIEKGKIKKVIIEDNNFLKLRVGLGFAQLSYTTPLASQAATAPVIYTDVLTEPYYSNLIAMSSLVFAMPLTGQQHYNFSFGTGPRFGSTNSSISILGEYMALGQDESETATSFSHSQMGVGLRYAKLLSAASNLSIHASYNGLGGDSTHMGFRAHYEKNLKKGAWGILFSYNMQTATSTISGKDSDFNQILAIGTYKF